MKRISKSDHAGPLLIVGGIVLTVLAATGAGSGATEALFAVLGPVIFVLGSFAHRIEGPVELNKDGFKTVIRAIDDRVKAGEIRPEDIPEVLTDAVDGLQAVSTSEQAVDRAVAGRRREIVLVEQAARHFEAAGFDVRREPRLEDGGRIFRPDLVVTSGDTSSVIEIKARPASDAAIDQVLMYAAALRSASDHDIVPKLLVPEEAGAPSSRIRARAADEGVELLTISADGSIRQA